VRFINPPKKHPIENTHPCSSTVLIILQRFQDIVKETCVGVWKLRRIKRTTTSHSPANLFDISDTGMQNGSCHSFAIISIPLLKRKHLHHILKFLSILWHT